MSPRKVQARDLLLELDHSRPASVSRQLEEQMRGAIRSGAWVADEQLPSTRVLAEDLGVSRGVILRAYGQLAAEGYISLRQGAAPTVRAAVHLDSETIRPPNGHPRIVYDLRPHLPDVATFPRQPWLRAVRESLAQARVADLTYSDSAGLWDLRVAVANYLSRARGVVAHPAQTLITAGSTHSLSLLGRALARRGETRMAFENPSHRGLRAVASMAGQTVVGAALDDSGVLPHTIDHADSLFVSPAHQFPTGVVLAPKRRKALVEWARDADVLILEDDYDAEFRYDRAPTGALQSLAPERVVYFGSTGKTFAPALRLGWMVLPEALVEDVSRELAGSMLHVSGLDQLAFANFLQCGDFDRHLRRMRQVYSARRNFTADLLARLLPDHEVHGIAGGLHAVLGMPSHSAAAGIRMEARAQGVEIDSIDQHTFADFGGRAGLVIGYGALPEPTLAEALGGLAEIIQSRESVLPG
ncbi:MAG TPA: PLP-dependent aminotransferase family protein [Gaiellaceae bacterium]